MATTLSTQEQEARRRAASAKGKSTGKPLAPKQDQKPVSTGSDQANKAQDQSDVSTKKARKKSPTHIAWEGTENFPGNSVITVNRDVYNAKPKRRHAVERFALYRDGMTVDEYKAAFKEKGWRLALADMDIRWDSVKGYITVKAPTK